MVPPRCHRLHRACPQVGSAPLSPARGSRTSPPAGPLPLVMLVALRGLPAPGGCPARETRYGDLLSSELCTGGCPGTAPLAVVQGQDRVGTVAPASKTRSPAPHPVPPQVLESGVLDSLSTEERKRQEVRPRQGLLRGAAQPVWATRHPGAEPRRCHPPQATSRPGQARSAPQVSSRVPGQCRGLTLPLSWTRMGALACHKWPGHKASPGKSLELGKAILLALSRVPPRGPPSSTRVLLGGSLPGQALTARSRPRPSSRSSRPSSPTCTAWASWWPSSCSPESCGRP